MKRRAYYLGILMLMSIHVFGQYGNEWIDYNRNYYKIPVASEGIFRLSYQTLLDAGIPLNGIDAKTFKIFHRGEEQAIFVENQGASQLEPGEYLEFYGQKNDGTLDANLYQPTTSQPHSYYNLYSDTTAYFLTWSATNGKRMAVFQEANVGALPAETSHEQRLLTLYTSDYSLGNTVNEYTSQSIFDVGEGWTGEIIQEGKVKDFILNGQVLGVNPDGDPNLELLVVGRNELADHEFKVLVGSSIGSLREIGTYQLSLFETITISEAILWTDIAGNGDLHVRIEVPVNASEKLSNLSVSYMEVRFAQEWDAQSQPLTHFYPGIEAGGKSYIEIINTPLNARMYDVTDPDNVRIIGYTGGANEIHAIVDQTNVARTLLVTNEDPIDPEPGIFPVSFQNVIPAAQNYIIITHPVLQKPSGSNSNAVQAYAAYRASPEGGGFDTLTVTVPDLINQYGYGEQSPLAIFNFMRRMVAEGQPEYLFLIGKALSVKKNYHRSDPALFGFRDLVPTGGAPASDVVFTAGLNGTTYEPAVATGRLTASTPDEVIHYLNKVKVKESIPFDNLWQKQLLHLSGGQSAFEKVQFESIVDGFGNIAEVPFLGGKVETVTKNTSQTVEFINVSDEINDGKVLVTFFGHSGPGITDIDIGYVSNPALGYANSGRYPSFIVNGCNAGDFFEDYTNWGADWLLTENLGATTFIAHTSFGFVSPLNQFTSRFYETGFGDSTFIDKRVGAIHKEASTRYLATASSSLVHQAQAQQMMLNGDPATRLFGTNLPDYFTNNALVYSESVDGAPITTSSTEFNLRIITSNYGAAVTDTMAVTVLRTFSDGSTHMYDTLRVPATYYQDTVTFSISNNFENNGGLNRFEIMINPDQGIPELNNLNNQAFYSLVIPLNGTVNALPYNYALTGTGDVMLKTQAASLVTPERTFQMEWDSSSLFNSALKQQNLITAKELAAWSVTVPEDNGKVYYWRSKYTEPLPGEEDEWEVSSFAYLNGATSGWGQLEFPQQLSAGLEGIVADSTGHRWTFESTDLSLYIKTYGVANPDFDEENVMVEIDGLGYVFSGRLCRDNTVNLIAFDKSTAAPYAALFEEIFSPRTCGRQVQVINNYTEAEILGADNYLVNYIDAVGKGDHVAFFSIGQLNFDTWTTEIWDKLAEIGVDATDLQALSNGDPFIVYGQKGAAPGSATLVTSDPGSSIPSDEQEIQLNQVVTGQFSSGTMTSTLIGPALSWQEAFMESTSEDAATDEKRSYQVLGVGADGSESILFDQVPEGSLDISSLDAAQYPSLRLKAFFTDTTHLTVPQLDTWLVHYESPPEGMVVPVDEQVAVQEGEPIVFNLFYRNISDKLYPDSLRAIVNILNLTSRETRTDTLKIAPPAAGDSVTFATSINSVGLIGLNDLDVFVDPRYPEQTLTNNFVHIPEAVAVDPDKTNPVVDVTFDGLHIFDGDIVSPSPMIQIDVRDSNPFLILEDTTVADVFITPPCEGCQPVRVNYSDPALQWSESAENEPFSIQYQPQQLENGVYTLEVQAQDASGNKAGIEPFSVKFEVINESTITNFYPYPNPFSTSTRFVFTLTGYDLPDEIKIQIMTVSGKVVREITQDELGPIRIGNNLSEYAWDGRDEYGDQLANGAYLYKVYVRINGETIDLRESAGDRAFKKGIGKLYLLR